jgi:hypothetical protein
MFRHRFTISSDLHAPATVVWARVSTHDGVNDEFWPVLRMTTPSGAAGGLRTGRLGRSWLLLGGVLPIDYEVSFSPRVRALGRPQAMVVRALFRWRHRRLRRRFRG